jgi:Fe-S oxidoreductase
MSPVDFRYWSIPGYIIFWLLFAIALGLFLNRVFLLFRLLRRGRKEDRSEGMTHRVRYMLSEVLLQRCNLKSVTRGDLSGIGHALMFWGFSLFLIGYIIFIGFFAGFGIFSSLENSLFQTVYFSFLDMAAACVLTAVIWAAVRRYITKPERLEHNTEAGIILILVFVLMLLHFLVEGFGYASGKIPDFWPPVGTALAGYLDSTGLSGNTVEISYKITWWSHYTVILGFLVYIPYSKHLHILASPVNLLFKSNSPKGALKSVDLVTSDYAGTSGITDFTWKQLLDLYSCTECGRCHTVCPAQISGKRLSPRQLILNLKQHLLTSGPRLLQTGNKLSDTPAILKESFIGKAVAETEIWDCVTCRACQEVCPVGIEHVDKLIDMRRDLVLMRSQFPSEIKRFYRNIEENGNPWGKPWTFRSNWAEGLNLKKPVPAESNDTVYWGGCLGAYDERIQRINLSFTRLLKNCGVNFTGLGKEEKCCGDAVRRTGNEYLFQKLAYQNIEVFHKHNIKRIITPCPHCYNVFKNEYPQFGGNFQIKHHTEIIADLLDKGTITLSGKELRKTVVFKDPCYLGRYNDICDAPRQIINKIPEVKLLETTMNGKNAMCCGAGGGHMWMSEYEGRRISRVLLEQVDTIKPEILVTACPYCLTMLENENREKGPASTLEVIDIVEILNKALSSDK